MAASKTNSRHLWLAAGVALWTLGCRTAGPLESIGHAVHESIPPLEESLYDWKAGARIEKGHARQAFLNHWHTRWD